MDEQQPNESMPETPMDAPLETSPPDLTSSTPEHTPEVAPTPPTKSRKKLIISMVAALVVLGIAAGAAVLLLGNNQPAPAPVKKAAAGKPKAASTTTILDAPKPLADLALFPHIGDECRSLGNSECPVASGVNYYEIGTRVDGTKLLLATTPSEGPSLRRIDTYALTKDTSGKFTIYGKAGKNAASFIDASKVTVNEKSFPIELIFPDEGAFGGGLFRLEQNDPSYVGFFINGLSDYSKDSGTPKKIGSIGGKDYYDVVINDQANFQVHEVFGALSGVYAASFVSNGPLDAKGGDKTAITWTDDSINKDIFSSRGPGCGSFSGYMTIKNIDASDLIKAGTDSTGASVYQLSTSNAFFQEVYTKDYANGEYLEAPYKGLTKDQFQAAHAIVVSKNGLGQYVAYLNETLIQDGGCAKPVVYLYPTKTSDVSVQVGALVTKSDPFYIPNSGWQHVTAQPSGKLTYQGKPYGSLFWEGLGIGSYPSVSSGTVVPSSAAVATIRQQLAAQGLNTQETNDFLAYWQHKLPETPFVRLSWLTTDELNTLAPLKITPAPQTVIRTFLDFQGLNLPINLAPQTFSTPARNGFTVVEWGGLLR